MQEARFSGKKSPRPVGVSDGHRLLLCKREAAALLSISPRALDYLLANKQIAVRRIGSRVLIPMTELQKFSRADHPAPLAG
jgi:excisionase family DNA binding protein